MLGVQSVISILEFGTPATLSCITSPTFDNDPTLYLLYNQAPTVMSEHFTDAMKWLHWTMAGGVIACIGLAKVSVLRPSSFIRFLFLRCADADVSNCVVPTHFRLRVLRGPAA
jgi:hypothetical protein